MLFGPNMDDAVLLLQAEQVAGEDHLAHDHRPLVGAGGWHVHVVGGQGSGERAEAAVADDQLSDRIASYAELVERDASARVESAQHVVVGHQHALVVTLLAAWMGANVAATAMRIPLHFSAWTAVSRDLPGHHVGLDVVDASSGRRPHQHGVGDVVHRHVELAGQPAADEFGVVFGEEEDPLAGST